MQASDTLTSITKVAMKATTEVRITFILTAVKIELQGAFIQKEQLQFNHSVHKKNLHEII